MSVLAVVISAVYVSGAIASFNYVLRVLREEIAAADHMEAGFVTLGLLLLSTIWPVTVALCAIVFGVGYVAKQVSK